MKNRRASIVGAVLCCITAVESHAFYNPSTGSWPSRDPIGEVGGLNAYAFVKNHSIGAIDTDGRDEYLPGSPGYSPWPGHPSITFPPKPPNPGPKPTLFYWDAPNCPSPLRTAFIQVGITPSGGGFVDDGTHGVFSTAPKCPPLYPASNGSFFSDQPGSAIGWSPFLPHHIKFIVCRGCLEQFCGRYKYRVPSTRRSIEWRPTFEYGNLWRVVSAGPCRVFHYPMLGGDFDLNGGGFDHIDDPPTEFQDQVNTSFEGVLGGACFGCKKGRENF